VPRKLIEHRLKVNTKAVPKKQRLRRFAPDKREAIKKEIAKLFAAGFMKEVFHPERFANPVLVKKKNNNEWRMCINYTNLNKHCPKDPFGLPRIDQVIDSIAGCVLLCFLDCYSGCHQIALKGEDQIKTAFITLYGAYAYTTISFGLKHSTSYGSSDGSSTQPSESLVYHLRTYLVLSSVTKGLKPIWRKSLPSAIWELQLWQNRLNYSGSSALFIAI
jgi:hypothetical protein